MKIRRLAKQVRKVIVLPPKEPVEEVREYLSTGSTLLNLAISDRPDGGFVKGKYFFLVGDSASGKTFLSMTCLAEAVLNPAFDGYRFIYDNVEDGMLMDVDKLFGPGVRDRLTTPGEEGCTGRHSETIEDFYYHVDDAIKLGTPFIYVLDSMDGLSSEAESDKFDEQKKAHEAGKDTAGSYGDGKAKKNSAGLRRVLQGLRDTGSILIIISQTRDVLNATAWGPRKTRSGGHALRFYACVEIWSSLAGAISKNVKGKPRKIGNTIQLKLTKNRLTGKLHEVKTAIYPSYGIDDVGACIDYLVDEGWWKKRGQKIEAPELELTATRDKLIQVAEDRPKRLHKAVKACWVYMDQESSLKRRPRYAPK